MLTAAIRAAGGPAYDARWVNPADLTDGGEPGGNIRQVFLFRPDRGVAFVDRPGGTATSSTGVYTQGHKVHLTASPGRINPTSPAWASSRKPLVGEFTFRGATVFAIANHFASKGGDDPLFGRWQQPVRASEVQRVKQAAEVRDLPRHAPGRRRVGQGRRARRPQRLRVQPDRRHPGRARSRARRMVDLPRTLPAAERYSYVYEGNSQVLDHILVSPALTVAAHGPKQPAYEYDIVHTNSEFHDQDSRPRPAGRAAGDPPGQGLTVTGTERTG